MRALFALTRNDFTLQWRYRIIAAYAVVISVYFVLIKLWAHQLPEWIVPALIYSDPAVLGYFFLGGLMMLERGENVRIALASSPLAAFNYLLAKAISLTAIAIIAVLMLALAANASLNQLGLLLSAVASASVFFISLGAVLAIRFKTVNAYLIGSVPILLPVLAPCALAFVDPFPVWANIFPPASQLKLILLSFNIGEANTTELSIMIAALLATTVGAFWWASIQLSQELGQK